MQGLLELTQPVACKLYAAHVLCLHSYTGVHGAW